MKLTILSIMVDKGLTFRTDSTVIEELQKSAKEKGINTSALLSHIAKSYIEWDNVAPTLGIIPVQKEMMNNLFGAIPDDQLKNIAIIAADKFRDDLTMITSKKGFEAFLKVSIMILERTGFRVNRFANEADEIKLIIQHGMGRKWSLFFATYYERTINNAGRSAKSVIREDMWTITIL